MHVLKMDASMLPCMYVYVWKNRKGAIEMHEAAAEKQKLVMNAIIMNGFRNDEPKAWKGKY